MPRFVYARWSLGAGTAVPEARDRDALLGKIADDLIERGDMPGALARVVSTGFQTASAGAAGGTRQVIDALRTLRGLKVRSSGQVAMFERVSERLAEVIRLEKEALEDVARHAASSGDGAASALLQESLAERAAFLSGLPCGIDSLMEELESYELLSPEARASFDDLRSWISRQVAESYFGQAAAALGDLGEPGRRRLSECLDAMSSLLEQRRTGTSSDAGGEHGGWSTAGGSAASSILERFGDLLPDGAGDLAGVIRRLASRISAVQDVVASMPEAESEQLRGLIDKALVDLDLRWQAERLVGNLRRAFPDLAWGKSRVVSGARQLDLVEGAEVMKELAEIEQLEEVLSRVRSPGELIHVDLGKVAELLGPGPASSLERLSSAARSLLDARLMEVRDGSFRLSPEAIRKVGAGVLADLVSSMGSSALAPKGEHDAGLARDRGREQRGQDAEEWTRPYEHGDQLRVNLGQTFKNALVRSASRDQRGPISLAPLKLLAADFEVDMSGDLTGASTVIALDVSLSMPMHGSFTAAKKVAIAVHALAATRFPRDFLRTIVFSERAREVDPADLVGISWDFVQGTNVQHALALARRMLAQRRGSRQVLIITDGEPTAHLEPNGEVFFCHPPHPTTVEATMQEVARCAAQGIVVNTFMLGPSASRQHVQAAEVGSGDPRGPRSGDLLQRLIDSGAGRVMFTTARNLGRHVLVDFVSERRGVCR